MSLICETKTKAVLERQANIVQLLTTFVESIVWFYEIVNVLVHEVGTKPHNFEGHLYELVCSNFEEKQFRPC